VRFEASASSDLENGITDLSNHGEDSLHLQTIRVWLDTTGARSFHFIALAFGRTRVGLESHKRPQ